MARDRTHGHIPAGRALCHSPGLGRQKPGGFRLSRRNPQKPEGHLALGPWPHRAGAELLPRAPRKRWDRRVPSTAPCPTFPAAAAPSKGFLRPCSLGKSLLPVQGQRGWHCHVQNTREAPALPFQESCSSPFCAPQPSPARASPNPSQDSVPHKCPVAPGRAAGLVWWDFL